MVDHLSAEGRSRNMAGIRARNTKPELALRGRTPPGVRDRLPATGYIEKTFLDGLMSYSCGWGVAVFVDGVFWHGHPDHWDPEKASSDYWRNKITRKIDRDLAANAVLAELGWIVV
jgi:DNA mismatch endonuclease (patch repair protein)